MRDHGKVSFRLVHLNSQQHHRKETRQEDIYHRSTHTRRQRIWLHLNALILTRCLYKLLFHRYHRGSLVSRRKQHQLAGNCLAGNAMNYKQVQVRFLLETIGF